MFHGDRAYIYLKPKVNSHCFICIPFPGICERYLKSV